MEMHGMYSFISGFFCFILYLRLISVIQFDPKLPFASENFIDSPELCVLSEGRKEQMETALHFERKSEW